MRVGEFSLHAMGENWVPLDSKCPDQLSMPFALWTRGAVRELIRREFGIRLSIRGVGEYLGRWGYTPQKAARRAYERDDAAVQDWLTIEYPKILARAK